MTASKSSSLSYFSAPPAGWYYMNGWVLPTWHREASYSRGASSWGQLLGFHQQHSYKKYPTEKPGVYSVFITWDLGAYNPTQNPSSPVSFTNQIIFIIKIVAWKHSWLPLFTCNAVCFHGNSIGRKLSQSHLPIENRSSSVVSSASYPATPLLSI